MAKKIFPLADLIYVATGMLLNERGMPSIYEILKFMAGEKVFSIQIPRFREECRPYLLDEFPWLKDIDVTGVDTTNWKEFLAEQIEKYGEYHEVSRIPPDDHTRRDVSEEAKEMYPHLIITVSMEKEEPPYGTIS